jgi:hypothetical protein
MEGDLARLARVGKIQACIFSQIFKIHKFRKIAILDPVLNSYILVW